jgi:hypothetical protein
MSTPDDSDNDLVPIPLSVAKGMLVDFGAELTRRREKKHRLPPRYPPPPTGNEKNKKGEGDGRWYSNQLGAVVAKCRPYGVRVRKYVNSMSMGAVYAATAAVSLCIFVWLAWSMFAARAETFSQEAHQLRVAHVLATFNVSVEEVRRPLDVTRMITMNNWPPQIEFITIPPDDIKAGALSGPLAGDLFALITNNVHAMKKYKKPCMAPVSYTLPLNMLTIDAHSKTFINVHDLVLIGERVFLYERSLDDSATRSRIVAPALTFSHSAGEFSVDDPFTAYCIQKYAYGFNISDASG